MDCLSIDKDTGVKRNRELDHVKQKPVLKSLFNLKVHVCRCAAKDTRSPQLPLMFI